MRLLEDNVAESFLKGIIKEGDGVIVDLDSTGTVVIHNKKDF